MTNHSTGESPHLTVLQLARRWHKTPQAIYNMRHRGKAPKGFKTGREVLFPIREVEAFETAAIAADPKSNRADRHEMRPAEPAVRRSRRAAA